MENIDADHSLNQLTATMSLMGPKEDKAAVLERYPSLGLIISPACKTIFYSPACKTIFYLRISRLAALLKDRISAENPILDLKEHGLDLTEKQLFSYIGATVVKPKGF